MIAVIDKDDSIGMATAGFCIRYSITKGTISTTISECRQNTEASPRGIRLIQRRVYKHIQEQTPTASDSLHQHHPRHKPLS
ncbi:hypothetical protein AKJ16_DCAP09601 [Drosera capensis]